MTIAWVIGSGGLLGSALCRALRSKGIDIFSPSQAFSWGDAGKLERQLATEVQSFGLQVQAATRWEIYWAAGVGTMGSPAHALMPETNALAALLHAIETQASLNATEGALALASSAGAIYAGCTHEVINDDTAPAPTTPYAHEKLKQEDLLVALTRTNPKWSGLAARISTLYGPGNSHTKQQGLIAHIARCILQNKPTHIYVPIDTIRDYITADDAAASIITGMHRMDGMGFCARIVASGQPTTIAEIISIYKRITRRNPRIVTSASKLSSVYSRRIQFHALNQHALRTSLLVGIAQVMAAERVKYTSARAFSGQ